jgi:23S rRNA (cytosine1962-C5)-methyltransferase
MSLPRVVLLPKRARPFYGRHPWVYAGAVAGVEGDPADGDEVELVAHTGGFVARGLYNSRSKIRVRLYSWSEGMPLDPAFFRARLAAAVSLRKLLRLDAPEGACRLVAGEGDGLSGLVVDRYADRLVMQLTSLAMANRREMLADLLADLVPTRSIHVRTEKGIGQLEGLELHDGPLRGEPPAGPVVVEEAGLRFRVNVSEGQKTGFYLDQRDNRAFVASLAQGRRVLDAFCYSGGFGLHAARAGASEVVGVDASEAALSLARENAALNGLTNVAYTKADVFNDLDERTKKGERFGVVVLDPPKFARTRSAVEDALRGYRRLLTLGVKLAEPDGVLTMCCCSGRIAPDMLEGLMAEVSADQKREVQLLARRGPAPDHPVSAACPESHYLKCLVARVR